MAAIWANSPKYNLSLMFTIYSRTPTVDKMIWTQTKPCSFSLRNLQGEEQKEQIHHALQIMSEVAIELHYLTGFGIDNGRIKCGSTTLEEVAYPNLVPHEEEDLWYAFAIVLKFTPRVYKWVKEGKEQFTIEEAQLQERWGRKVVQVGRRAAFRIPAVRKDGFFYRGSYGIITYNKQDQVFTRFIKRFEENGNLSFGQSRYFGSFSGVRHDYWPQAKHPEKYDKKLPRKSRLATQPTDTTEYVYIIKISGQNIYKIGKSNDPQGRLKSLKTSNPYNLKIVHTFKADNASAAEETLHELLYRNRMKGEWFNITHAQSKRLLTIERFEQQHFWIDNQAIAPKDLFDKQ